MSMEDSEYTAQSGNGFFTDFSLDTGFTAILCQKMIFFTILKKVLKLEHMRKRFWWVK